jgi:hypothetical protein
METSVTYFKGMAFFLCGTYFWGVLAAYLYRLPAPLVGYVGPFGEFESTLVDSFYNAAFALAFYSVIGGLPLLIGVPCWIVYLVKEKLNKTLPNALLIWVSLFFSFFPVFFLSNLDYIIGEW